MSEKLQMEKAFLDLRGHLAALNAKLVHYKITCNIDGVCVLKNSEQGEVIPIFVFRSFNKQICLPRRLGK